MRHQVQVDHNLGPGDSVENQAAFFYQPGTTRAAKPTTELFCAGHLFNNSPMKRITLMLLTCTALSLTGSLGCQQEKSTGHSATAPTAAPDGKPRLDDFAYVFLPLAGSAGIFEVELGKVAEARATRPTVKAYAHHMVMQHTAVNTEYRELMQQWGLVPPDTMMKVQRQLVDSLRAVSAATFDQRYVAVMVNDHRNAIRLFAMADSSATYPEYKEWIKRMRVVVKQHYDRAVILQDSVGTGHSGTAWVLPAPPPLTPR